MGATSFMNTVEGFPTAKAAFDAARAAAREDFGSGGYTGTIAEKDSFVIIPLPKGTEPYAYARKMLEAEYDPRITDKWGPAGCIELGAFKYLFFGYASE